MKRLIAVVLALAVVAPVCFAGRDDVGTSGGAFLKIPVGSRPSAMGDTYAGVADDVNAIFYNPGGAANIEKIEFSAAYYSWFQNIKYSALSAAYPVSNMGTFGIGILNLGVDSIEKRTADTVAYDSLFSAGDYAYILHYSRKLGSMLDAGVNLKYITQKIDTYSANSSAADIGIFHRHKSRTMTLGLSVQNIGSGLKFISSTDPLPLNIKLGTSYKLLNNKLLLALDVNMPRDNDTSYSLGAEYNHSMHDWNFALRGGYKTMSAEKLGGSSGLSAGVGASYREFGFDFAWVPYGLLGDTLRYSFIVKF